MKVMNDELESEKGKKPMAIQKNGLAQESVLAAILFKSLRKAALTNRPQTIPQNIHRKPTNWCLVRLQDLENSVPY